MAADLPNAGKAASLGGAALLGGLAYKAYSNWQHNKGEHSRGFDNLDEMAANNNETFTPIDMQTPDFQLRLIKSMIASAKADGHIDATEQQRIFRAVEEMNLSSEIKGIIFDLLHQDIAINELVSGNENIEQKSEIYLVSCLVIDLDQASEQSYLAQLEKALGLPDGLAQQLQWQAQRAMANTV